MDHERATTEELRWRIEQLEARLSEQVRINKDIENSTIWRATAPLRSILKPVSLYLRHLRGHPTAAKSTSKPPIARLVNHQGPLTKQPWDSETSRHLCIVDISWDPRGEAEPARTNTGALGLYQLNVFDDRKSDAEPVVKIDFGASGNASLFQVFGFENAEHWGVWTRGSKSRLLLWLPEAKDSIFRLELIGGLRSGAVESTRPLISVNDVCLGPIVFSNLGSALFLVDTIDAETMSGVREESIAAINNVSKLATAAPLITIIILNYNKPYLTFLAVCAILKAKTKLKYEILVLDNGSKAEHAAIISSMDLPVRWIRLEENRFFGEGNNIAAEMARGEAILFLNNDVFIEDLVLDHLYEGLLSSPAIGATGPVLYYPDGSLQEAGAFIAKDGSVYQRGKGSPEFDVEELPAVSAVDYVSAACLMVNRQKFLKMGGFDLRYDPAYYEDSDLCLRLLAVGLETLLLRDCHVTHIENATTADPKNRGLADNLTDRHRRIFLTRWQTWLKSRKREDLPKIVTFEVADANQYVADANQYIVPSQQPRPINVAFTPYPLSQGGGERYILRAALAMNAGDNASPSRIATPTTYSRCRINNLCHELGLPANKLSPIAQQQCASQPVERYIHMGNELVPSSPGIGNINIFHCQFPFPNSPPVPTLEIGLKNLSTYDFIVVNSEFTKNAFLRALRHVSDMVVEVRVIYPPVKLLSPPLNTDITKINLKEKTILSVGRICPTGHPKRQELIISAFKKLRAAGKLSGWRLVLSGTVPNDPQSQKFLTSLQDAAQGYDIDFILSPDRDQVETLYRRASIYVSATGATIKHPRDFHKCEHFGITVVEAISAGCIAVVAKTGGPAEIVSAVGNGYLFSSTNDLMHQLLSAAQLVETDDIKIDHDKLVCLYSEERFDAAWQSLWLELCS